MVDEQHPFWFKRGFLAILAISICALSLYATIYWGWREDLFASSGALVTVCGLFLNIKHTMVFHLDISEEKKYNIKAGAGIMGSRFITDEQKAWTRDVLKDEKYGVAFMIIGTVIWAYGTILVEKLINYFF